MFSVYVRVYQLFFFYWDGIIPARFIQPFGSEMICDPSPISHMTLQVDGSRPYMGQKISPPNKCRCSVV